MADMKASAVRVQERGSQRELGMQLLIIATAAVAVMSLPPSTSQAYEGPCAR
jgi:hypothetical protein